MNLRINIKQPATSLNIVASLWLLLIVGFVIFTTFLSAAISIGLLIVTVCLLVFLSLLHIKQIKSQFSKHQLLLRQSECWYLKMTDLEEPMAISLQDNTRIWPYWILLVYKTEHSKKIAYLWLPKDCMKDKDYRDLSRCLNFGG